MVDCAMLDYLRTVSTVSMNSVVGLYSLLQQESTGEGRTAHSSGHAPRFNLAMEGIESWEAGRVVSSGPPTGSDAAPPLWRGVTRDEEVFGPFRERMENLKIVPLLHAGMLVQSATVVVQGKG